MDKRKKITVRDILTKADIATILAEVNKRSDQLDSLVVAGRVDGETILWASPEVDTTLAMLEQVKYALLSGDIKYREEDP